MPQTLQIGDTATNKQTGDQVRWDGKAWSAPASTPGAFQTQPGGAIQNANTPSPQGSVLREIAPTFLKSFGIDTDKVEGAKSYLDALKGAGGDVANATGEGMFNSLVKAGPLAPIHMAGSMIDGMASQIEEGSKLARDSFKSGDSRGLTRGLTQVASAMGQVALMRAGGSENVGAKALEKTVEAPRDLSRTWMGAGKGAERVALGDTEAKGPVIVEENKQALASAASTKTKFIGDVLKTNAEKIAKYRDDDLEVQRNNKREMAAIQKLHEQNAAADADVKAQEASRQQSATEARKHATDLANGQLQEWQAKAKAEGNAKYDALEDPNSPTRIQGSRPANDIHATVSKVIKNELKGSERPPAILKKILDESQPEMSSARALTENEQRGGRFAADLMKRGQSIEDVRAALPNYGYTGSEVNNIMNNATGATVGSDVKPYDFKKLHGLSSELGYAMRDLHGDELHAADVMKKKVDGMMDEMSTADNKKPHFDDAQNTWNKYFNTFENYSSIDRGGSPIAKAMQSYDRMTKNLRTDSVMGALSDDVAHKLAMDQLDNFKHLNLRTDILADMKSKLDASKEPVVRKPTPPMREPNLKPPTPPPELEPLPPQKWDKSVKQNQPPQFDANEWRKSKLHDYQKRMGESYVNRLWQVPNVPYWRAMNALYSNPTFIKYVLGIK